MEEAHAVRDSLQSAPVVLLARAGQAGRFFGAITPAMIADAVASRATVDKRRMHVAAPIKTLGEYQVQVGLHDDVTATVTVQVVPED